MIVMKFGGASLASAASIKRVACIVLSELQRNPVIVVSAMGDTTDHLLKDSGARVTGRVLSRVEVTGRGENASLLRCRGSSQPRAPRVR